MRYFCEQCLNYVSVDELEEELLDDQPLKLPPVGPPSWDSNVVCIQPSRNLSRPEGHEEAEENNNVSHSSSAGHNQTLQYKK